MSPNPLASIGLAVATAAVFATLAHAQPPLRSNRADRPTHCKALHKTAISR